MGEDIRVIVGLDFGIKYSSFAYAHILSSNNIIVHDQWQGMSGSFRNPTVLKYDESFNLISWGYSALSRRKKNSNIKLVENFLLCLSRMDNYPPLPNGLSYKQAITDYLREMRGLIEETINSCYPGIDFYRHILFVMPVSTEYDEKANDIMRACAHNADIISYKNSSRLVFITKHEANSFYCINTNLNESNISVGTSFMVVDCGNNTIDITTQNIFEDKKFGDITGKIVDYCGGNFVDDEFIKFVGRKVGLSAIDLFRSNHYDQFQYMVKKFCERVKFQFTGQQKDFNPPDLDFYELCPAIEQYVKDSEREQLENQDWIIELKFEDVKAMFDPVIERILHLIRSQLYIINDCEAIFLVGEFSQSNYLQARIKQEFSQIINIPTNPLSVIVKGAVQYGLMYNEPDELNMHRLVIASRVFNKTYGIKVTRKWNHGDPIERKLSDGMINIFLRIAKRGDEIPINTGISMIFSSSFISRNGLDLFVTNEYDVKYCDSPEVSLLNKLRINAAILSKKDAISITLIFDNMKIKVIAQNVKTDCKYETELDIGLNF
ncbi:hypothetical protein C1645_814119 [Glomus cerebriforme]|uniref:Hsp70 family protein n=1 Tax=Glomus cerebriforme TaxID=658196 RepID=A0A397TLS3_9GLOM|nr:hypothetical protein C1645_814119 [Glomus cerebriforme]